MTNIYESDELEQSRIGRALDWLDTPLPQIACLVGMAAIIAVGGSQAHETETSPTKVNTNPPTHPTR